MGRSDSDTHSEADVVVIVVAWGAWGKGKTYKEALTNCMASSISKLVNNHHVVYVCTDPDCTMSKRGNIKHARGTVNRLIMTINDGKIKQE